MSFWKVEITTLFFNFFIIITYNLSLEFDLERIMFQWLVHSAPEYKYFSPMTNTRYGVKINKKEMIDNDIFFSEINQKILQMDVIDKIKNWYKTHVILICLSDPTDCQTKMNKILYLYLTRSV